MEGGGEREREKGTEEKNTEKTNSVFLRERLLLFPVLLSALYLYISSGVKQEGFGVIHNLINRCGQQGSFKHNL